MRPNLIEVRHDLLFPEMDLGLSEKNIECYLDLGTLSLIRSMVLRAILKKTVNFRKA